MALVNDMSHSEVQGALSNIIRLCGDVGDRAIVAVIKCRENRRTKLCTEVRGKQDGRRQPTIVVFPAGEWSGQTQGTTLTSGQNDDIPIHHALKAAAIMINQMAPLGHTLFKDIPKNDTIHVGAMVNVYTDDFDAERAGEGEDSDEVDEEYVATAREATVTRIVSDDEIEVQYDD